MYFWVCDPNMLGPHHCLATCAISSLPFEFLFRQHFLDQPNKFFQKFKPLGVFTILLLSYFILYHSWLQSFSLETSCSRDALISNLNLTIMIFVIYAGNVAGKNPATSVLTDQRSWAAKLRKFRPSVMSSIPRFRLQNQAIVMVAIPQGHPSQARFPQESRNILARQSSKRQTLANAAMHHCTWSTLYNPG